MNVCSILTYIYIFKNFNIHSYYGLKLKTRTVSVYCMDSKCVSEFISHKCQYIARARGRVSLDSVWHLQFPVSCVI